MSQSGWGSAWLPVLLWLSRSPGWQSSAWQSRVRVLNRIARAWTRRDNSLAVTVCAVSVAVLYRMRP